MNSKHIPSTELYKQYYSAQAQKGGGAYFSGRLFQRGYGGQRGRGIGSIFGSLFRKALPFLTTASKTLGRAALKTGANVLSDTAEGGDFRNSLRNRMRETGGELKRNATNQVLRALNSQTGAGKKRQNKRRKRSRSKTPAIKRRKLSKPVRSSKTVKQRRSPKKRLKPRTFEDIFGS